MKTFESIAKIQELLPRITKGATHLAIDNRERPGMPVSGEELDGYMLSKNLCGLGKAWIELSRHSAEQHLHGLLESERVDWFEESTSRELPKDITQEFLSLFNIDGRFFCNGLICKLDEHPIIRPDSVATKVCCPFPTKHITETLYRSWANFSTDLAEDCFGIVAIDTAHIGMLLIKPSWIDLG